MHPGIEPAEFRSIDFLLTPSCGVSVALVFFRLADYFPSPLGINIHYIVNIIQVERADDPQYLGREQSGVGVSVRTTSHFRTNEPNWELTSLLSLSSRVYSADCSMKRTRSKIFDERRIYVFTQTCAVLVLVSVALFAMVENVFDASMPMHAGAATAKLSSRSAKKMVCM